MAKNGQVNVALLSELREMRLNQAETRREPQIWSVVLLQIIQEVSLKLNSIVAVHQLEKNRDPETLEAPMATMMAMEEDKALGDAGGIP